MKTKEYNLIQQAGSAGANFSLVKNREQVYSINANAHLQYKTEKDLWLLLGDYGLLKSKEQEFVSNSFGHLRYNRKLNESIRWEAFLQLQNNNVTNIKLRFLAGTGPRFKLTGSKKFRLYVASLVMYEYEKEKTSPPVYHNDIRNSSYITFTFSPAETIQLTSTTFFQPLIRDFSDNRLYNQVVLKVKATKYFAMNINWDYLYDSSPAGNAPKETYSLSSGISFEF